MNEKIKQLAKQHFVRIEFERGGVHECYEFSMEELEQFAELIVRECARVADVADENKCEWIGGNILTHFGVEE